MQLHPHGSTQGDNSHVILDLLCVRAAHTEVVPVCGCRIGIDIILAAKSQYLHRRFPSFRPASRRSSILVLIGKEAFQRVAI